MWNESEIITKQPLYTSDIYELCSEVVDATTSLFCKLQNDIEYDKEDISICIAVNVERKMITTPGSVRTVVNR